LKKLDEKKIFWFVSHVGTRKNSNYGRLEIDTLSQYAITFFCQGKKDVERAKNIMAQNGISGSICSYDPFQIPYFLAKIKNSTLVITERYHGAVLAEALHLPWYSSDCTEKLT